MFRKVIWSPVEIEWLQKNKNLPVSQLTQALAKSTTAVKRKLAELSGKPTTVKTKKKQISKIGRRKDCDNLFFRSVWEADLYRYLKYKSIELNIKRIEVEPTTFSFAPFGILKGTVAYTPDFKVTFNDDSYWWIEVKGFLRRQDATKIRRFKKYYPHEFNKLKAVTGSAKTAASLFFNEVGVAIIGYYSLLKKKFLNKIPHWGE